MNVFAQAITKDSAHPVRGGILAIRSARSRYRCMWPWPCPPLGAPEHGNTRPPG